MDSIIPPSIIPATGSNRPLSVAEPSPCVVTIITNGNGSILMGRRNDNKKWTLCAGHIEPNEIPEDAAKREVYEETGLTATHLTQIPFGPPHLHFYSTFCTGTPHTQNDPDHEVSKWVWVDTREGIPSNIWDRLAGPDNDTNILKQLFVKKLNLQKSEQVWLDGGFMELQKSNKLLNHPDPRERALALKFNDLGPQDLSIAILDPDHMVWHRAFEHPNASHALEKLSNSTRDSSGTPLFDRHDHFMRDPRVTPRHLVNMEQALDNDAQLDPTTLAQRRQVLKRHPLYPKFLGKSEDWAHKYIAQNGEVVRPSRIDFESEPTVHKDLLDHYNQHINSAKPLQPEDADLHTTGRASPKLVYKTPTHSFMVKPYFESENQQSGWNETTSQAVHNAVGLGNIHQKSFIASHGSGYDAVPVVAINLEKATPLHTSNKTDLLSKNPELGEQARQLGVMDFLTGNNDRHGHNLMIKDNSLLAIDHANSFNYDSRPGQFSDIRDYAPTQMNDTSFHRYTTPAQSHLTESTYQPEGKANYFNTIKNWWPQVSLKAKQAFQERVKMVKDPGLKENLTQGFGTRAKWLDDVAQGDQSYLDQELKKALGDAHFLHDQHKANKDFGGGANTVGVHAKLAQVHPPSIQSGVDHFENNINKHPGIFKPVNSTKTGLRGIAPKAHYEHTGKGYIVKPAIEPHTKLAAWNELTSQAMYHAGGIGHLHQNVHATVGNMGDGKEAPTHGVAIHMDPGSMTMFDAMGGYKGTNIEAFSKVAGTKPQDAQRGLLAMSKPEHKQALKQIGLMDYLVSNPDRHGNNIMLRPDGQPLAIDNSLSFHNDRKHAYGPENAAEEGNQHNHDMVSDPNHQRKFFHGFESRIGKVEGLDHNANALYQDATVLGGHPDQDTYKWWEGAKQPILDKFKEHLNMIPGANARKRMSDSFMVRYNNLNDLSKQHLEQKEIPSVGNEKMVDPVGATVLNDTTIDQNAKTVTENTLKGG